MHQAVWEMMGRKLVPWYEPQWLRPVMHAELEPGEALRRFADFWLIKDGARDWHLLVLTDRNLRTLKFKETIGSVAASALTKNGSTYTYTHGDKPRAVSWSHSLPIPHITAVGVGRTGSLLTAETRSIAISSSAGETTWWTNSRQGEGLIELLVSRVNAHRPAQPGVADEISRLASLTAEGVLSAEEFDRAKALFIGQSPSRQTEALNLLRHLHGLLVAGVLTEGEYNMKKWDVLARSEGSLGNP